MLKLRNFLLSASFFLNIMLVFLWLFESGIQQLPSWIKVAGRLHPMVLHFPVALLLIIALLELMKTGPGNRDNGFTIDFLLAITAFTAALAALCGFFLLYGGGYENSNDLYWHKISGISTSLIAGLLSWLRGYKKLIYIPALISGCIMLIVTGHLGSSVTHGAGFITEPLMAQAKKIKNVDEAVVYEDMVQPIFNEKCIGCHNPNKQKGELLLTSYKDLIKGGENGAVIFGGNADTSTLYNLLLLPANDDRHMPPEGKPQPDAAEIAIIKWWINNGADAKQKFKDANAPDSIKKIIKTRYDAGSALDQLNIAFADIDLINKLNNNDRGVRQLSIEKPYINVFLANRRQISDNELEELSAIKNQITGIDLSYSNITNPQLQQIARFPHLRAIHLENSNVTDSALGVLSSLKYLEYLNVSNTAVTSAVFTLTEKIKSLNKIFVYGTEIKPEEIAGLKKSRPAITVGYTPDLSTDTSYRGKLTDPDIVIDSNMFINSARVEMNYRLKGVDIFYTLDGSEPDSSALLYKAPVTINRSGTLKVAALRAGWQASKTLRFDFEKVSQKFMSAKLEVQPDTRYTANRDSSLIDFKRGATDGADDKYIGFEGNDMTAWLDLGDNKPLSELSVSYLVNHGSFVVAPAQLELWSATGDGQKLKRLAMVSNPQKGLKKEAKRDLLIARFPTQSVRYLYVKVHNVGKLPAWHPAKGSKSWMFIDELIAN